VEDPPWFKVKSFSLLQLPLSISPSNHGHHPLVQATMSWSYRFQAFPTTSIVTLTYQFVYQERDHEAFQPLSTSRIIEDVPYLVLSLWADGARHIYTSTQLPLDIDGKRDVVFPVTEAGECVAILVLYAKGRVALGGNNKISIPPTVKHSTSS